MHSGVTRFPEISDVPYLDVVAEVNQAEDEMTAFCINRHLTEDTAATLQLAGFVAGDTAKVQTLSAKSIYDANDEANPTAVTPIESAAKVEANALRLTFRHASVTRIDLRRK